MARSRPAAAPDREHSRRKDATLRKPNREERSQARVSWSSIPPDRPPHKRCPAARNPCRAEKARRRARAHAARLSPPPTGSRREIGLRIRERTREPSLPATAPPKNLRHGCATARASLEPTESLCTRLARTQGLAPSMRLSESRTRR